MSPSDGMLSLTPAPAPSARPPCGKGGERGTSLSLTCISVGDACGAWRRNPDGADGKSDD